MNIYTQMLAQAHLLGIIITMFQQMCTYYRAVLHSGQALCMRSHRSTQPLWNTWLHCCSCRTLSPFWKPSRQIEQSATCTIVQDTPFQVMAMSTWQPPGDRLRTLHGPPFLPHGLS